MSDYLITIGLEVHVQLKTQSKMFCSCSAAYFGAEPNTHVCPVCLGLPGALPVPNGEAIREAVVFGLALNSNVLEKSKFDRKNYFYPDLAKGYQISQFNLPFSKEGYLEIEVDSQKKKIRVNRAHLEEDTGKLSHSYQITSAQEKYSLVDFNRSGVPLLEIVSEPDLNSPFEARLYAERLHQIARYLGVADTEMEKAGMRFDGNISLRPESQKEFGTKVEVKNINSFKFLEKALEYEVRRQAELLNEGRKIVQETRGYIEDKDVTVSQRSKEESPEYRYFPEPDIPDVVLTAEFVSGAEKSLVELPPEKIDRFQTTYGLSYGEVYLLTLSPRTAEFFETGVKDYLGLTGTEDVKKAAKPMANWIINSTFAKLNQANQKFEDLNFTAAALAELIFLIDRGKLNQTTAKEVFNHMYETGESPRKIMSDKGLVQISDLGELEKFVSEIIEASPKAVADFKIGKEVVVGFLVGQVMAKAHGKADPGKVRELLIKKLKDE